MARCGTSTGCRFVALLGRRQCFFVETSPRLRQANTWLLLTFWCWAEVEARRSSLRSATTVDPHREAEILRVPHEQVDMIARHLPPLNQSELFESGSARRGDWTMLDLVSQAAHGGLARAILVGR